VGFGGYILRPELMQVCFIELMEIHALCGGHSRLLTARSSLD
jgi:hypothetical protein